MKYIVKQCPSYLLGKCCATAQNCQEITNCKMKNAIDECLQFNDVGRIDYIMNCKNLSERGRLSKKFLQMFEVEEIRGFEND